MLQSAISPSSQLEIPHGVWKAAMRQIRRYGRGVLIRVAVIASLVVGLVSLLLPKTYTSGAIVFPQVLPSTSGRLASIAAQFGLASFAGGLTLDFYIEVLQSRAVIDSLLVRSYSNLPIGVHSLLDDLGYTEGPLEKRLEKGAKKMAGLASVSADQAAGTIRLSLTADSPELAVEVAESLLAITNRSVANALIAQATFQRQYLEGRLVSTRAELSKAESALEDFYRQNRTYQQSPDLVFRESRLRRESDLNRDVYMTVRQEYEQARLSEARDVPTLSFVSGPSKPYKKSSPKPVLNAVLAFLAALSTGIGIRWMRVYASTPDSSFSNS
jgi:uncharacterized protein involved in exopolysaccharide biosynthesis